jgi:hypothetical protein
MKETTTLECTGTEGRQTLHLRGCPDADTDRDEYIIVPMRSI